MKNQLDDIKNTYFKHAQLTISVLEKGQSLFNQNDLVEHIYFLQDGELSIIHSGQTMWQAFHNEFIGISSYFNRELNFTSSVRACKTSKIITISLVDFNIALKKYPELNKFLMQLFNDRINLILEKAKCHSTLTRKKRLLRVIVDKVERNVEKNQYIFNYTNKEIAEFIGAPLYFVKKNLVLLQEKKLISIIQDSIEILDFKRLKTASE